MKTGTEKRFGTVVVRRNDHEYHVRSGSIPTGFTVYSAEELIGALCGVSVAIVGAGNAPAEERVAWCAAATWSRMEMESAEPCPYCGATDGYDTFQSNDGWERCINCGGC